MSSKVKCDFVHLLDIAIFHFELLLALDADHDFFVAALFIAELLLGPQLHIAQTLLKHLQSVTMET